MVLIPPNTNHSSILLVMSTLVLLLLLLLLSLSSFNIVQARAIQADCSTSNEVIVRDLSSSADSLIISAITETAAITTTNSAPIPPLSSPTTTSLPPPSSVSSSPCSIRIEDSSFKEVTWNREDENEKLPITVTFNRVTFSAGGVATFLFKNADSTDSIASSTNTTIIFKDCTFLQGGRIYIYHDMGGASGTIEPDLPNQIYRTPRLLNLRVENCLFEIEPESDPAAQGTTQGVFHSKVAIGHLPRLGFIIIRNNKMTSYHQGVTLRRFGKSLTGPFIVENNEISVTGGARGEGFPMQITGVQSLTSTTSLDILIKNNTITLFCVAFATRTNLFIQHFGAVNSITIVNNTLRQPTCQVIDGLVRGLLFLEFVHNISTGIFIESNSFFQDTQVATLLSFRSLHAIIRSNASSSSIFSIAHNTIHVDQTLSESQSISAVVLGKTEGNAKLANFDQTFIINNTFLLETTKREIIVVSPQTFLVVILRISAIALGVLDRINILHVNHNNITIRVKQDYRSNAPPVLQAIMTDPSAVFNHIKELKCMQNTIRVEGKTTAVTGVGILAKMGEHNSDENHYHGEDTKVVATSHLIIEISENKVDLTEVILIDNELTPGNPLMKSLVPNELQTPPSTCVAVHGILSMVLLRNNECKMTEVRFQVYAPTFSGLLYSDNFIGQEVSVVEKVTVSGNRVYFYPLPNEAARNERIPNSKGNLVTETNPFTDATSNGGDVRYVTGGLSLINFMPSNQNTIQQPGKSVEIFGNYLEVGAGGTLALCMLCASIRSSFDFSSSSSSNEEPKIVLRNNILNYSVHHQYRSTTINDNERVKYYRTTDGEIEAVPLFAGSTTFKPFYSFIPGQRISIFLFTRPKLSKSTTGQSSSSSSSPSSAVDVLVQNNQLLLHHQSVDNHNNNNNNGDLDGSSSSASALTSDTLVQFVNISVTDFTSETFGRKLLVENNTVKVSSAALYQEIAFVTFNSEDVTSTSFQHQLDVHLVDNTAVTSSSNHPERKTGSFVNFVFPRATRIITSNNDDDTTTIDITLTRNMFLGSFSSSSANTIPIRQDPFSLDETNFIRTLVISDEEGKERGCNYIFGTRVSAHDFFVNLGLPENTFRNFVDQGCSYVTPTRTISMNNNYKHDNNNNRTVTIIPEKDLVAEESSHDAVLSTSTNALQGVGIAASAAAAAVVPSLGFGIARQQAMINFVQNMRSGNCAGVSAIDGVPAADSPTQMSIGDSESRFFVGGAAGNFILSFGMVLAAEGLGAFILHRSKSSSWNKPFAVFARCNVALILFVCSSLLLAPTLTFGLVALTQSDVTMGEKILVVIFSLLGFAIPTFYYAMWSLFLRSNTKLEQYRKVPREGKAKNASKLKKLLTYWFEGEGEWMLPLKASLEENLQFDAATPLLEGYNKRAKWFGLAEFIVMFGLALAPFIGNIVPLEKSCVTVCIVLLITLGGFLLLCLYFRPFQEFFNRIAVPIVTACEMAVIIIAYAFAENPPPFIATLAVLTSSLQSLMAVIVLLASLSPLTKHIIRAWKRFSRKTAKNTDDHGNRRNQGGRRNNNNNKRKDFRLNNGGVSLHDLLNDDDDDGDGNVELETKTNTNKRDHHNDRHSPRNNRNDRRQSSPREERHPRPQHSSSSQSRRRHDNDDDTELRRNNNNNNSNSRSSASKYTPNSRTSRSHHHSHEEDRRAENERRATTSSSSNRREDERRTTSRPARSDRSNHNSRGHHHQQQSRYRETDEQQRRPTRRSDSSSEHRDHRHRHRHHSNGDRNGGERDYDNYRQHSRSRSRR